MISGVRIIDLTRPLHHLGPSTGTQPRPMIFPTVTHESTRSRYEGAFSIASMGLVLSDHAGTHVDAWSHLSPSEQAESIDLMPLDSFIGEALVVDVSDAEGALATGSDLCARLASVIDRHRPSAVLFRTGAVQDPLADPHGYLERFRGLGADIIECLADHAVRMVGTDARSIDASSAEGGHDGLPAHRACLERRVVVCENLDLSLAPDETPFLFVALPLKLTSGTGSPVRAVALLDT